MNERLTGITNIVKEVAVHTQYLLEDSKRSATAQFRRLKEFHFPTAPLKKVLKKTAEAAATAVFGVPAVYFADPLLKYYSSMPFGAQVSFGICEVALVAGTGFFFNKTFAPILKPVLKPVLNLIRNPNQNSSVSP